MGIVSLSGVIHMDFNWFDEEDLEKMSNPSVEDVMILDLTPEKIEVYTDAPGVLRPR
jgi:hypothetical protein